MSFTDSVWNDISPIFQAILDHPFNKELAEGSLSEQRFSFYIQQDMLYLNDFARALAILGSRSPDTEEMLEFIRFAEGVVVVEQSLHEQYFELFGIDRPTGQRSPACFMYTNFLLAATSQRTFEVGVAAVLPCFWVYREVGRDIYRTAGRNNPYRNWIDTYASEEFSDSVEKAIEITGRVASRTTKSVRESMQEAFLDSARLEWIFWDSAYRLESWQPAV